MGNPYRFLNTLKDVFILFYVCVLPTRMNVQHIHACSWRPDEGV